MEPTLCIAETDKIGDRCYATYGPEIGINNPSYDIVGVGNPNGHRKHS